jgi:hypothetical protein
LSKTYRRLRNKMTKRASGLLARAKRRLEHMRYRGRETDLASIGAAAERLGHPPRPDFIIIGAPKCGTSWLHRALGQHPAVVVVPEEIEYFSLRLEYSPEWYLNHFARQIKATSPPRGVTPVIGEKSARYCSIPPDRIRMVHRLLPNARLILMIRDPVARHWSQAKRYFSKRRFGHPEGGVLALPRRDLFAYFEQMRPLGEFSAMIANWVAIYAPEQLLIVSQERALSRPREAYDAALEHIGASRDYDPASIKLLNEETNLGPKVVMPDDVAQHLEAMFAPERERLRDLLGDKITAHPAR